MQLILSPIGIRALEILAAPFIDSDIAWSIAPLLFALVTIQMYFGKYKTEQLGWNTAFGNTISLMWVTAILLRFIHERSGGLINSLKIIEIRGYVILVIVLAVFTFLISILEFNHKLPRKYAFLVSSALPINLLAFFSIIIVMMKFPLNWTTFWACFSIFLVFALIFKIYRWSITPAKSILPTLERSKEKHEREVKERKKKFKKIVQKIEKPVEKIVPLSNKKKKKSKKRI